MKIKPEHYEELKSRVGHLITPERRDEYAAGGHSPTRFLFDATYTDRETVKWICNTLYRYLNDSHLETALKRIAKEKGVL